MCIMSYFAYISNTLKLSIVNFHFMVKFHPMRAWRKQENYQEWTDKRAIEEKDSKHPAWHKGMKIRNVEMSHSKSHDITRSKLQ